MRDDAARALRVDDEPGYESGELHAVGRRFGRPSEEATMALRHFERIVDGSAAVELDRPEPVRQRPQPFERARTANFEPAAAPVEREEPVRVPRSAPGRSYGSHRRDDAFATPP